MAALLSFVALLAVQAAPASPPPAAPAAPSASAEVAATLDGMLEARDYNNLFTAAMSVRSVEEMRPHLDWEQARMTRGASGIVAFMYARDLWRVAAAVPPDQGDQLRQTAAAAWLYAYGAVQIDGARCADRTAPQHRVEQLFTVYGEILRFLRAAPIADRRLIVRTALLIEQRSAPGRAQQSDEEFLCRFGMDEMRYGLEHGTTREVPTQPGQIGRTMAVTSEGYRPRTLPEAEWRPLAQQRRAELPQTFATLAELSGAGAAEECIGDDCDQP